MTPLSSETTRIPVLREKRGRICCRRPEFEISSGAASPIASCDQEGVAVSVRLRHNRTKRMAKLSGVRPIASNERKETEYDAMSGDRNQSTRKALIEGWITEVVA